MGLSAFPGSWRNGAAKAAFSLLMVKSCASGSDPYVSGMSKGNGRSGQNKAGMLGEADGCVDGCEEGLCAPGCECFGCVQYRNYLDAGWPQIETPQALELAEAVGLLGVYAPLEVRQAP
jgi:hypothetical protein